MEMALLRSMEWSPLLKMAIPLVVAGTAVVQVAAVAVGDLQSMVVVLTVALYL